MTAPEKKKPGLRDTRLAMYKGLGGFGTLGFEILLSIGVASFAGAWADGKLGTSPWLTLLGVALGVATAVRAIQRALAMMNREAAREECEQGNPKPIFETSEDRSTRLREARKQREVTSDEAAPRPDERERDD
ncbi:MAG: AtpZ/AtpI family protein [Myxococcales bacterium]|nr:AtpZ/AtpI family protein [Myxococcales bacterium]